MYTQHMIDNVLIQPITETRPTIMQIKPVSSKPLQQHLDRIRSQFYNDFKAIITSITNELNSGEHASRVSHEKAIIDSATFGLRFYLKLNISLKFHRIMLKIRKRNAELLKGWSMNYYI